MCATGGHTPWACPAAERPRMMSQAGAASWLNGLASGNAGRYARASHDSFHPTPEGEENRTPPSVRRAAGRRQMPSIDASPNRSSATFRSGNEALYEAYNALHSLAQDFEKPFDAPAILVVGHQTDGKSGAAPARRTLAPCALINAFYGALWG